MKGTSKIAYISCESKSGMGRTVSLEAGCAWCVPFLLLCNLVCALSVALPVGLQLLVSMSSLPTIAVTLMTDCYIHRDWQADEN